MWFNVTREPIWLMINEFIIEIVHVGSTSIEGMSAKPVIDIDIVVDNWDNFPEIIEKLNELGYVYQGDLGIKEREAFKSIDEPKYPHNLYVCHKDSIAYKNHRLLKKHLSENLVDFKRYKALKIKLGNSSSNVDEYTRLKTELILEFLASEGVQIEEIDVIRSENLS